MVRTKDRQKQKILTTRLDEYGVKVVCRTKRKTIETNEIHIELNTKEREAVYPILPLSTTRIPFSSDEHYGT